MIIFTQVLILSSLIFIFLYLIKNKRLNIREDFFYIVFVIMSFIYLFIFPILRSTFYDKDYQLSYLIFFILISIFFYIPFFYFYLPKNGEKTINKDIKKDIIINENKLRLLLIFSISLTVVFYYISFKYSIFFVRETIYDTGLKEQLSIIEFWIFKTYIDYSAILIFLLYYIKFIKKDSKNILINIIYIFYTLAYLLFCLFNYRLFFIVIIIQIIGQKIIFENYFVILLKNKYKIIFLLIILFYGYIVVIRVRSNIVYDGITLEYLNPAYKGIVVEQEPLFSRLDAINLMMEMTPKAINEGFALGRAWFTPLFLTIGPVIAPEKTSEIKSTYLTDSEGYFLTNYTDIENYTMDVCSVYLTDAYGNFFLFGFIIVAIVLSKILQKSKTMLLNPNVGSQIIIAIYFFSKLLVFELEFITLFTKLIKSLPFLFILYNLNPIYISKILFKDQNEVKV